MGDIPFTPIITNEVIKAEAPMNDVQVFIEKYKIQLAIGAAAIVLIKFIL